MAFLKKILDKPTYMLVVGIWNVLSLYLLQFFGLPIEVKTLILAVGNLVLAWLGTESGNNPPPPSPPGA